MTLYYYLTRRHLEQFILYTTLNAPSFKESLKSNRISWVVSALILSFVFSDFPQSLVIAPIAAFAVYLLLPGLQKKEAFKNARKIANDWDQSEFNGVYQASFFENCLLETQPRLRLELPYSSLVKIAVDWPLIYIYYNNQAAVLIPLDIFKNEADIDSLLNFLCYKNPSLSKPVIQPPKLKNRVTAKKNTP